MDNQVFAEFQRLIYRTSGISLSEDKRPLLSNRIFKRLRQLGIENSKDYLNAVVSDSSGEELSCLIDAISTNVTYFYREAEHFERLAEMVREHSRCVGRRLRIWCAASSSGEEPYTIALTVLENLCESGIDFKLLATDINTKVISHAIKGCYGEKALRDVPPPILKKYFVQNGKYDTGEWQIKPFVQENVIFRRLNLIDSSYPFSNPVDIVFCRNVMIYFDLEVRTRVVNKIYSLLRPGGYLFVSKSENLLGLEHGFSGGKGSVYQKLE